MILQNEINFVLCINVFDFWVHLEADAFCYGIIYEFDPFWIVILNKAVLEAPLFDVELVKLHVKGDTDSVVRSLIRFDEYILFKVSHPGCFVLSHPEFFVYRLYDCVFIYRLYGCECEGCSYGCANARISD